MSAPASPRPGPRRGVVVLALVLSGFPAGGGGAWGATDATPVRAPAAGRPGPRLAPEQQRAIARALEPRHRDYDPVERMIRRPFSSPGYHTTLQGGFVHPTRDSLNYAVALLDTGEVRWQARAADLLRRVLALQDTDPQSRTYGLWSWFLEEPLAQMAPPDWNWADFCGVALLQVALDHRERLPPDLAQAVDTAIRHAARSIQRRNVGPSYTNIALMGTYVTFVAGEHYGDADLLAYARARLRRFHDYTQDQGAFTEYNSPTYTLVALTELGRLRQDVRDPDARALIEPLYRLAWQEIAGHFHAPTRQWAGPHSRCYSTLLGEAAKASIQRATGGRVDLGVSSDRAEDLRVPLPCPSEFEAAFVRTEPHTLVRTFLRGDRPIVGTTRFEAAYALSSVNRGDWWNQRRPLLAYWGTPAAPAFLRPRLLRDDYDFAAGQCFSAQRGSAVLAGVNFATDGGQRHVSLDRMKAGRFAARDLRFRFEFGGAARGVALTAPKTVGEPLEVEVAGLRWRLHVARAWFGAERARWEVTRTDDTAGVDLVLWSGAPREIDLSALGPAALIFTVEAGVDGALEPVRIRESDALAEAAWRGLRLTLPLAPAKSGELQARSRAWVDAQ